MERQTGHPDYLIVLGAGPQQRLAYEVARRLGLKTLAVDQNAEAVSIELADEFLLADIRDEQACLKGLRKRGLPYRGVMTLGAEVSPTMAKWSSRVLSKPLCMMACSTNTPCAALAIPFLRRPRTKSPR